MIDKSKKNIETDLNNREDYFVENKIVDELLFFDKYPYSKFLEISFKFTESKVIPLSSNAKELQEDLYYAKLFIEGKLKKSELYQRHKKSGYRLKNLRDIEYRIQKFILIFLEWNFLCDVIEECQQNDHVGIFFELLYEIKEGLCTNFLNFLIENLHDKM
ncbi:hypothetical protein [Neisseria sp. 83E34]|uniref:hypothetical protein n=1 Tax=Neisseria sp. 83E34 TaxID=1692264 RepID=UPI0006CE9D1A|nr:hypothetical protein [Neisseria sp. 83E34]KPN70576.1 hypothetical protein AKG09_11435 [Neisseria sp. 83E34]